MLISCVRCWWAVCGADRLCVMLIGCVWCWSAVCGADRLCVVLVSCVRCWWAVCGADRLCVVLVGCVWCWWAVCGAGGLCVVLVGCVWCWSAVCGAGRLCVVLVSMLLSSCRQRTRTPGKASPHHTMCVSCDSSVSVISAPPLLCEVGRKMSRPSVTLMSARWPVPLLPLMVTQPCPLPRQHSCQPLTACRTQAHLQVHLTHTLHLKWVCTPPLPLPHTAEHIARQTRSKCPLKELSLAEIEGG